MYSCVEGETVSRYDKLKQVQKTIGQEPPGLCDRPELPPEAQSIWNIFTDMSDISYSEIQSYQALTGETLGQWEIKTLMLLRRVNRNPKTWQNTQNS